MRRFSTCLLIALLAVSCSRGRVTTSERVVEGPDGSYSTGTSYSLHSDREEARLEKATQAATSGDYRTAIEQFEKVYRSATAEAEQKEKALFGLGSAWSNLLNNHRDFDKALRYLDELVEEYPESKLRPRAEEKIATIRGITGG